MTRRRVLAQTCLAIPLLTFAAAASAQETECHANEAYAVTVKPYAEDAGSQFFVKSMQDNPPRGHCVFDPAAADLVIGEPGDPLWFGELTGDFLVATRSTGPQGDLVVFELATGDVILDVPADEYAVEEGRLSFWQRTEDGNADNCPAYAEHQDAGFGSAIAERGLLELATGELVMTGERRCDATQ